MDALLNLYAAHPFWVWLAVGAVLLGIEAGTGSGWLLWPAASAGVVALVTLAGWRLGLPVEIGLFALLTLGSTVAARRFLAFAPPHHPDINDSHQRLIGKTGQAVTDFVHGKGRALIANAEWGVDLESSETLASGAAVVVTGVSGSRLIVRAL